MGIRSHPTSARRRSARFFLSIPLVLTGLTTAFGGCGPDWTYTYVKAEKRARAEEKPILVCYRDHLDRESTVLAETLESGAVRPLLDRFVLCSLISAYQPNRRFAAQYGVTSAPALVIVYPDGTYHALADVRDPETIRRFLQESRAPGARPSLDIGVPRPADFLIRAEGIFERAQDKAERLNRPMLIVYKWWLDGASTEMLKRLSRPEVAARCQETINCVLDWDYQTNRRHMARFGVSEYPAVVVVHRDGSYAALRGLKSVDEIVGFLTAALAGPQRVPQSSGAPARPGLRWLVDYAVAAEQAQTEKRGLLVFFHAPADQASAVMMQQLQSATAATLFRDVVKCSLALTDEDNADVARRYGIAAPPAVVAIRPDGTYRTRTGALNPSAMQSLHQFLQP